MDTKELVSWFRMAQIDPYYGTAIQARFEQAADTIERLQRELERADQRCVGRKKERDEGWTNALRVQAERDAALAQVERLKAELLGIYSDQAASDQARFEIRRKSDAMGR